MPPADAIRLCVAIAGAFLCVSIAPFGETFSFGLAGFIGAGGIAMLVGRR